MAEPEGSVVRTALLVGVIVVGAAALVTGSYDFSKERIAANERARLVAHAREGAPNFVRARGKLVVQEKGMRVACATLEAIALENAGAQR